MNFKNIIKVVTFLFLIICVGAVLTSILQFQDIAPYMIQRYYEDTENENFNVLFLGSSHFHNTMDTHIIDDELNVKSYILTVGSQKMGQSYFLLKEAMKYDDIDVVALELYSLFLPDVLTTQKKSRVSQNMSWSLNKIEYLIEYYGFPDLFFDIFPILRYHDNFSNPSTVISNLENYGIQKIYPDFVYHGYYSEDKEMTKEEFKTNKTEPTFAAKVYKQTDIENYDYYELEKEYLLRIIDLCKKNDIEVLLVKTPVISYFGDIEQYSENYTRLAEQIASEYEINYIEYNYLHKVLGLDHSKFKDVGHVNKEGSQIVTNHFVQYYNALHDESLKTDYNYVISEEFEVHKERGGLQKTYDSKYGEGTRITKIYDDKNYNFIAKISNENIKQQAHDFLPYMASCIVKNISHIPEHELKYILSIHNGINGTEKYQYRTVEHLEGDYYLLTVHLESNVGACFDVRINSNLPKDMPIEVYQVELYQKYVFQ